MVDSHFHVQLTAVLDVLMKTAVSDICALAESWFKSLHLELARSKKENEDLKKKLQSLEQKTAAETAQDTKTTKEEKDEAVSEVRDTEDTEENGPCFALISEHKPESEKYPSAPQSLQCSFTVGSSCETENEECVLLDEVCETERIEEKQQSDLSVLWSSDLRPDSTYLLKESQLNFTNTNSRITSKLGKELTLPKSAENAKHLMYSKLVLDSLACERGSTFTCNVCGKNLSTKNSLASHYRLHTREKLFACTLCGKRFAKKFNLEVHYNIHTGAKPYVCTHCPKSFADPSAFRRHEWVHTRKSQHTVRNTKFRFSCNTCGKLFLSKISLSAHSQLHTTEKRQKVVF
ncbi:Gastrula zinc finger protein XlCGF7.1 [Bagarius yarrelli]|uniref:Gastrula zinc finger protein XlCGF7.1 n=1 Tax=Bagarius yarrelli TaxID=175774 RepID=A0A556TJU1_BAGYA|nr:Gastrula zinc finger protein XlCGF7.1 [Bagarius yarrelli]